MALASVFGRYFTQRARPGATFLFAGATPTAATYDVDWIWPRSSKAKRWRRYVGTVTVRRTGADSYRWSLRIRRSVRSSNGVLGVRTVIKRSGNA